MNQPEPYCECNHREKRHNGPEGECTVLGCEMKCPEFKFDPFLTREKDRDARERADEMRVDMAREEQWFKGR